MFDLHVHALPGVDDGPADMAAAVALVARAHADGTRTIAATPHVRPDHPLVRPSELARRTQDLARELARAGVDVDLVSGGEADVGWALQAQPEALRQASYAGRGSDLLVETPYGELPGAFEEMLFSLAARGYRITLAHPERNPTFQRRPERLAQLVARGTLVQLTAVALSGATPGSESRRLARALLREGVAHVIATDAHGPAVDRTGLRAGVDAARLEVGARADWMVTDAPAAILAGEPLPAAPAARPRSRLRLPWRS